MENIPFIIIKLDTERKLRLSNKAFYIFESTFGKTISDIEFDRISVSETNQLIYAGLKSQDETITFEEVVDLLDKHMNFKEAVKKVMTALEGSSFLPMEESILVEGTIDS